MFSIGIDARQLNAILSTSGHFHQGCIVQVMVSKEDVGFELQTLEQACRLAQVEAASTTNDIESQLALMNITRAELATTSREDSDDDSSSGGATNDDDDHDTTSSDCSDESSSTSSSSSDDEVDDSTCSAKTHDDEILISSSSPAAAVTTRQSLLTTGARDVDNQSDKGMSDQKTQHELVLADSKTDQLWTDSKSEAKSCSSNSSSCSTTEAKDSRTDTKSLNF